MFAFGICYYDYETKQDCYNWFETKEEAIKAALDTKTNCPDNLLITDKEYLTHYVTFLVAYKYSEFEIIF